MNNEEKESDEESSLDLLKAVDAGESKTSEFNITDIYTPLAVAKKEVWRRWNDPVLRRKAMEYLGGDIPVVFKDGPRAVISRHVISPNMEFEYFVGFAKDLGLPPLGLEGAIDTFHTINPEKAALGKMVFIEKEAENGGNVQKTSERIIDMEKCEGKRFCDIETLWGEGLVDFHHRILNVVHPNVEIFDDFQWFKDNGFGIKPQEYYRKFFVFFLCFGVLFENFLLNKSESNFTRKIIGPVFLEIESVFGIKPLIMPLAPMEDAAHSYWRCYPYALKDVYGEK